MKIPEFSDRKKNVTKVKMEKEGGKMDFETYKDELNLIYWQNDCELDLYHLVGEILRYSEPMKKLSLRDVSARRHSPMGEVFYGLSGFPDLVILDTKFKNSEDKWEKFDNENQMYGAVEIKSLRTPLYDVEDILNRAQGVKERQKTITNEEWILLGECIWYRKLIYTNGKDWKFVECGYSDEERKNICEIVKKQITGKLGLWVDAMDFKKIEFCRSETILKEENFNQSGWNQLIAFLNSIQWNQNQPEAQTK
jgi:hypothetical protein